MDVHMNNLVAVKHHLILQNSIIQEFCEVFMIFTRMFLFSTVSAEFTCSVHIIVKFRVELNRILLFHQWPTIQ